MGLANLRKLQLLLAEREQYARGWGTDKYIFRVPNSVGGRKCFFDLGHEVGSRPPWVEHQQTSAIERLGSLEIDSSAIRPWAERSRRSTAEACTTSDLEDLVVSSSLNVASTGVLQFIFGVCCTKHPHTHHLCEQRNQEVSECSKEAQNSQTGWGPSRICDTSTSPCITDSKDKFPRPTTSLFRIRSRRYNLTAPRYLCLVAVPAARNFLLEMLAPVMNCPNRPIFTIRVPSLGLQLMWICQEGACEKMIGGRLQTDLCASSSSSPK